MVSRARKTYVNEKVGVKVGGAKGLGDVIEPQPTQQPTQQPKKQPGQDGSADDKGGGHGVEDYSDPLDIANSFASSGGSASSEPGNSKILEVGEEAAVGSIHHILKTAFKELYTDAGDGQKDLEQIAATANEHDASGTIESLQPCFVPVEDVSQRDNGVDNDDSSPVPISTIGAERPSSKHASSAAGGERAKATLDASEGAEEVDVAKGAESATHREAEMAIADSEDDQQEPRDLLTERDKVMIQERKSVIEASLQERRDRAEGLRAYTRERRLEARALDREVVDSLKKRGILLGAHIPMGPSELVLDHVAMNAFQEFAVSLLDAAELTRANKETELRASGNLPWDSKPGKMHAPSVGAGNLETPGHLRQTATISIREALALRKSTGRRGQKRPKKVTSIAAPGAVADGGSDETVIHDSTALDGEKKLGNDSMEADDDIDSGPRRSRATRSLVRASQREANSAIMDRMQIKLRFRRNPRFDKSSHWHEQLLTALTSPVDLAGASGHHSRGRCGGDDIASSAKEAATKGMKKKISKTELLTARPPPGCVDGENGFLLATPSVVEYFDYEVGETYRAELLLRNISCLKRTFILLPPSTEFFCVAKVLFPAAEADRESGIFSGNGEIASGMAAQVLIDFAPDTLGEYHDVLHVVTEAGTFEVPIHAHRQRPCLSLPSSGLVDCGRCLLGEGKTVHFTITNSGGLVRFRLFPSKPSICRIESSGVSSPHCGSVSSNTVADSLDPARGDRNDVKDDGDRDMNKLEDGSFRVFPRDYDLPNGGSVVVNVEYLPSEIGLHEARFRILQDNCKERELSFRALCEQVSLRISSIDDRHVPVPLKQRGSPGNPEVPPGEGVMTDTVESPAITADIVEYAEISHLIFEPTILASTRRRRLTLRNDTIGDLPIRWEICETSPKQSPRPPPNTKDQHASGAVSLVGLLDASESKGIVEYTREAAGQSADGLSLGRPVPPWVAKGSEDPKQRQDSEAAAGGFDEINKEGGADRIGGSADGDGSRSARKAVAKKWPFSIAPEFVVVPSRDEVSFEVAFSPTSLGYSEFEATAIVSGVPAVALSYHNPSGKLADVFEGVATAAERSEGGNHGGSNYPGDSRFRLFLRSLDPDSTGSFDRERLMDAVRSLSTLLRNASDEFKKSNAEPQRIDESHHNPTTKGVDKRYEGGRSETTGSLNDDSFVPGNIGHGANEVDVLVEEAIKRLDPFDDDGNRIREDRITTLEAAETIGAKIQDRFSHAFKDHSLEDLVKASRVEMSGLQIQLKGFGEAARLSLKPAMLQAPGELTYGEAFVMAFEVCNASTAPVELEFDLGSMLVYSENDAFTVVPGRRLPKGSADHATLTPYCTGNRVVEVPILAPTAVPPELGEQLSLRLGFVGRGGAIRIEFPTDGNVELVGDRIATQAAEVDLGLIAVDTEKVGAVKLRNTGDVPVSFAMLEAGTASAASTAARLRTMLYQRAHALRRWVIDGEGQRGDGKQLFRGATDNGSVNINDSNAKEQNQGSLEETASLESTGEDVDMFCVDRDCCRLVFEPTLGDILPGRCTKIAITCQSGRLPERFRTSARVLLQSCDERGVSFGSEYVSVRAEIQEPMVYISTAEIDVGTAYLGVPVRRCVSMVNLSNLEAKFKWERPGGPAGSFDLEALPSSGVLRGKEVREVEMRYTARRKGSVDDVYACRVFGMASPLGFVIKGKNKGLTLSLGVVENDSQVAPQPIQRPHLPQYVGEEPLPEAAPVPSLEFGTMELRDRKKLRLFVQNLSAISTTFAAKVRKHSCTPCPHKLKITNMSYTALRRVVSNPRALKAYLDDHQQEHSTSTVRENIPSGAPSTAMGVSKVGEFHNSSVLSSPAPADGSAWRRDEEERPPSRSEYHSKERSRSRSRYGGSPTSSRSRCKMVLGEDHEATEAFFSKGGRARTMQKIHQREDYFVLKGGLGAAFLVEPTTGVLPPWGVSEINVTSFNDTPGRYNDKLEMTFTGAPTAYVPMKMAVQGSPLSLKPDAFGLDMSGPEPLLSFGEVFIHGRKAFRIFKVRNEGTLPALLKWSMQDATVNAKEAAKKVDLFVKVMSGPEGGWVADVDVSYRQPRPFQSPFVITPSWAMVDPRSEGSFKVILPETIKGTMTARLVADASWLTTCDSFSSSVISSPSTISATGSAAESSECVGTKTREFPAQPRKASSAAIGETAAHPAVSVSPLQKDEIGMKNANIGFLPGARHNSGDVDVGESTSLESLGGNPAVELGIGNSTAATIDGGDDDQPEVNLNLLAVRGAHVAVASMVEKTLSRKQEMITTGAVTLKAIAWGIEPRLALDKKTHAVLLESSRTSAGGLAGEVGNPPGGGLQPESAVGKQFLKFETVSTKARTSSTRAAHPSLRRQVSLSNLLTIPVSFRLETRGPFVVNPVLPGYKNNKTRFPSGPGSDENVGASDVVATGLDADGAGESSRKTKRDRGGDSRRRCNNPGKRVASCSRGAMQLLPGQSLQLELVFLPARAPAEEMAGELLQSSFTPGSEAIPELVLRTEGQLRVMFCTGHLQTIWLKGEVLRPMITVAPATHSFGTVHTERSVNVTLFLGNPTFADAEWSLAHVPAPLPKHRLSSKTSTIMHERRGKKVVHLRKRSDNTKGRTSRQEGGRRGVAHNVQAFSTSGGRGGPRGGIAREEAEARAVVVGDDAVAEPSMIFCAVVDDPSVFEFGERRGVMGGVKLPLKSSAACLPEDWNRFDDACWPQQPTRVTWGGITGSPVRLRKSQRKQQQHHHHHQQQQEEEENEGSHLHGVWARVPAAKHGGPEVIITHQEPTRIDGGRAWKNQPHGQRQAVGSVLKLEESLASKEETAQGYRAPRPLEVTFRPKRDVVYRSRFRLTVKGGESAEFVLEGVGTYREDSRPGKLPRV